MTLNFSGNALDEYFYWQKDKKMLRKVNNLLKEIRRTPFEGSGNPEALKHELSGCWSRRINKEHRIIYKISIFSDDIIDILGLQYHY